MVVSTLPKPLIVLDMLKLKPGKTRIMRCEEKETYRLLSRKAMDYYICKKALYYIPDVRHDKMEPIKQQMESGKYFIDIEEVVNHILSS